LFGPGDLRTVSLDDFLPSDTVGLGVTVTTEDKMYACAAQSSQMQADQSHIETTGRLVQTNLNSGH
jgi:hypothetical protein